MTIGGEFNNLNMKTININELEDSVREGKFLVDFYADWCGPCRAISPVLQKLDEEGEITVLKINVDDADPMSLSSMGIKSIPTLMAFENGSLLNRASGMQNKEKLLSLFE
jgi:thioredoxin 1